LIVFYAGDRPQNLKNGGVMIIRYAHRDPVAMAVIEVAREMGKIERKRARRARLERFLNKIAGRLGLKGKISLVRYDFSRRSLKDSC